MLYWCNIRVKWLQHWPWCNVYLMHQVPLIPSDRWTDEAENCKSGTEAHREGGRVLQVAAKYERKKRRVEAPCKWSSCKRRNWRRRSKHLKATASESTSRSADTSHCSHQEDQNTWTASTSMGKRGSLVPRPRAMLIRDLLSGVKGRA